MSPDRIRAWYARARKHKSGAGAKLRAIHERVGSEVHIAEWDCADLDAFDAADFAEMVAGALQEHADAIEESARFRLEYVSSSGAVLATTIAKAQCERPASPDASSAADVGSANQTVAMLMRHLENRERMLNTNLQIVLGSVGATLGNMRQVIEQNSADMRAAREQQDQLLHRLEIAMSRESSEASEEDRTEALARARAWERIADLGPAALELMLAKFGATGAGH